MTTPGSSTDSSRKHARYFVLVLVAGLLVLFLYMISGIVAGLVAGILLWVMTRWIYDWLLKRTRGRQGMAAGLAVLATLLLVIVPLAVIILIMTADAMSLAGEIQSWIPAVEAKINEWTRLISRNGLSLFGYDFSPEEIVNTSRTIPADADPKDRQQHRFADHHAVRSALYALFLLP